MNKFNVLNELFTNILSDQEYAGVFVFLLFELQCYVHTEWSSMELFNKTSSKKNNDLDVWKFQRVDEIRNKTMILPVAKLGALFIKSLGKPLAKRLKNHAAKHPRFRQFIVNIAQSNHRFQVNLQRRIYGHDTDVAIHPLNPDKAVQAASDLLGEFIIFVVGGTIVILEVQRSSRSEAFKEAKMRAELDALRERDRCTLHELDLLKARIDELEKADSKPKPGRASWTSSPTYSVLRNRSEPAVVGPEIQTQTQRSLVQPPSNQSNTTEPQQAPQN